MATIDAVIVGLYFLTVMLIGFYFAHHKKDTPTAYFLADRNLGWFVLGISLFATNISSEHFVGLAGYGAGRGLAVGNIEWLAIPFLMLLGRFFAPIFLKAGIFTVPEFFGRRFNTASRMYLSGISIISYLLTKISVSLFAGGVLLKALLGWDMYTSAVLMVVITGIYTIVGGMRAVVFTSLLQGIMLIVGAVLLTALGLWEVGGISGLQAALPESHFSIFKPVTDPDFPWTGILFGAPILAIWYWCTDQYIVQRVLCARDAAAAREGTLFTGFLKILPMFILVVPGLIAAVLYPGIQGDDAYASLLTGSLLPVGVKGIVLVGVLAALMSSLSGCFISASTLFTMDFYRYFRPNAPDKKLVLVGQLATTFTVGVAILWIPLIRSVNSHLYVYLQSLQAFISPPIAAVFFLGLFWKRLNGRGAIVALIGGGLIGGLRLFLEWMGRFHPPGSPLLRWLIEMNFLHFAALLFCLSALLLILGSFSAPVARSPKVEPYTLPWKGYFPLRPTLDTSSASQSGRATRVFSVALLLVLIGLWGIFF
ncbi:MAG: sodium transporter [Calditrichaeota bacterium]|nr:MAG: sodium transporter [Calditrichota bacterium]